MYENEISLQFVEHEGQFVIDSRNVADMIDREHKEVLAMIEGQKHRDGRLKHVGFLPAISESGLFNPNDFFIESSYKTKGNNKTYKCYLLTKKGCDLVATRMTGAKGTLFAAKYIEKFNEMEEQLKSQEIVPVASYMIGDPIKCAEQWIEEQKEKMLL
ncbi:Rha family transcriptional regulator [Lysinibacillus sp. RSDA_15]|uniref:Rha family transcriptional regulator n=1 Tax=Lysinibacillus TaxID=400634 RepID=UPI0018CD4B99|nr:Rha family transcriptional regulator [Lysinibacillus sphaericus]QTB13266.1 Rha family transcriptional regulator [Lysinibacillus sphaericus]